MSGGWIRPSASSAWWYVGGAIAAAAFTFMVIRFPDQSVAFAVAGVVLGIALLRPRWIFVLFLLTAFMTLPDAVPRVVPFLGVGLYLYEPFLYIAFIYLVAKRARVKPPPVFLLFAGIVIYMFVLGVAVGNQETAIIADTRPLVDLIVAAYSAYLYLSSFPIRPVLITTRIILWASMVLTVVGSIVGLGLAGRDEASAADADRLITGSTYFSLAVVAVCAAALVSGSARVKQVFLFAAPALIILFVSLSRNNILAIAVAIVWGAIAASSAGRRVTGIGRLFVVVAAFSVIVALLLATGALPWLQTQVDGFSARVLGGLSNDSVLDSGRNYENLRIVPVILEQPIFGHGLGATYKEAYGPVGGFYATRGPAYAHNFYYWLLLKGGVLSMIVFVGMALAPLMRVFRRGRPEAIALTGALFAFLVVSVVAPMPVGFPTAALLGLILGSAYFFTRKPEESTLVEPIAIRSERRVSS